MAHGSVDMVGPCRCAPRVSGAAAAGVEPGADTATRQRAANSSHDAREMAIVVVSNSKIAGIAIQDIIPAEFSQSANGRLTGARRQNLNDRSAYLCECFAASPFSLQIVDKLCWMPARVRLTLTTYRTSSWTRACQ
jgi:hypothetical protein